MLRDTAVFRDLRLPKKPRQGISSQMFSSETAAVFLTTQNRKTLEVLLLFNYRGD